MVIAARGAAKEGLCDISCVSDVIRAVKRYGLCESFDLAPEDIAKVALSDKKRAGAVITLVLPEYTGHCVLKKLPVDSLCDFFKKGTEE